ncbi:MAG: leucyl/phenylalanyl-tRNA---protein transferase [Nocardioidaceae bacterium]|nr:leucyl/phenylalanyl-tRNA---protein transferase [Nocardioidaceae bacterium]MDX6309192.1 leucyl/phenylalanyl-tRNA---protein transferase [Nocardioidaceae bacterium]
MPVEPPPTSWVFSEPDPSAHDLVAFGADLAPGTLLAAYRRGIFPMPLTEDETIGWFSPVDRAVLPLDGLRVTRSMRQSAKRFTISVDRAFADVVRGCADPAREGGWIDEAMVTAYRRLHGLGWAHSVEAWRGGSLAGGLYGVAIGGLFCGESMFQRERDASKVALMALVDLLGDDEADRLLDVQWATPHLASLGVVEIGRSAYLRLLPRALALPLPKTWA